MIYSDEARQEIIKYFLDGTNSSECSGMKECIKIKVGDQIITVQKRILWFDLKDLYLNWIRVTKLSKVPCLAFFCKLKPKQCFFAGEPGTHNICVCILHQNIKLKLAAVKPKISYKEVIEASVCSVENKLCMIRDCEECPSQNSVYETLLGEVETENIKEVTYSKWTSVTAANNINKVSLQEFKEPADTVLKSAVTDIYSITEHHFIATKQKQYYSLSKKELLKGNTGVLCMDFAENYSFIAQDSIQGIYFNNSSATLFNAILFYRDPTSNEIKFQSFCVISDSSVHEAYAVHAFIESIYDVIKQEFAWIESLDHFTDGAPTQFKNK